MVGNLVENDQRRRFLERKDFRQRADLEIPMGAVNVFDLVELSSGVDKFAQVIKGHNRSASVG